MEINRTAVKTDTPGCFGLHMTVAKCSACPYEPKCIKHTNRLLGRQTLREAADDATFRYKAGTWDASVNSSDLLLQLSAAVRAAGARPSAWGRKPEWHEAMDIVIASCREGGWNPHTYMKAQSECIVKYCTTHKYRIYPSMFVGEAAAARFRSWTRRNQTKFNDARRDKDLDQTFETLLRAESKFGQLYITKRSADIADLEDEINTEYPIWSLKTTEVLPHVRLPALSGAASVIHPMASQHILVPKDGTWGWEDARIAILDLFAPVLRVPVIDHDALLGSCCD